MALVKPRIFQVILLTRFVFHGLLSTSSVAAASTYNFIANQRPRFQIPHGNLSYYRSPQWEVLYYLKFGTFPFYSSSSPFFNRTAYLNKIRMIKNIIDRKNDPDEMEYDSSSDSANTHPTDLSEESPTDNSIQNSILNQVPVIPTANSGEDNNKYYRNYYPLAQNRKNNQVLSASSSPISSSLTSPGFKLKRENIVDDDKQSVSFEDTVTLDAKSKALEKSDQNMKTGVNDGLNKDKKNGDNGAELNLEDNDFLHDMQIDDAPELGKAAMDYFLVDGDPSWFVNNILSRMRSRVSKQIPTRHMFPSDSGDGSLMHGGGSPIAAEMTIERKVGRKFQTQGWK